MSSNSISTPVKTLADRLSPEGPQLITKKKLQDLVREMDPKEQLDEDVEEMLLQAADDFVSRVATAACQLTRHRKSGALEVKDVQLHLERRWNTCIPGYGALEVKDVQLHLERRWNTCIPGYGALEVKDVQLHLERRWNTCIPGYGSDHIRPYRKACTTEAHRQRMTLILKSSKK